MWPSARHAGPALAVRRSRARGRWNGRGARAAAWNMPNRTTDHRVAVPGRPSSSDGQARAHPQVPPLRQPLRNSGYEAVLTAILLFGVASSCYCPGRRHLRQICDNEACEWVRRVATRLADVCAMGNRRGYWLWCEWRNRRAGRWFVRLCAYCPFCRSRTRVSCPTSWRARRTRRRDDHANGPPRQATWGLVPSEVKRLQGHLIRSMRFACSG